MRPRDLPDISALALGRCAPSGVVRIYQANHSCPCYNYHINSCLTGAPNENCISIKLNVSIWSSNLILHFTTTYLDDKAINQVEFQRDLGLMISGGSTWLCHYKLIIIKAYKILGLIHCRFASSHNVNVKSLYNCEFIQVGIYTRLYINLETSTNIMSFVLPTKLF